MIWDLYKLEAIRTLMQERLGIVVQQSRKTLTSSGKPLFPIYIFLPLAKLRTKFEHLMEEVAWSYWLKFFLKIRVVVMKSELQVIHSTAGYCVSTAIQWGDCVMRASNQAPSSPFI